VLPIWARSLSLYWMGFGARQQHGAEQLKTDRQGSGARAWTVVRTSLGAAGRSVTAAGCRGGPERMGKINWMGRSSVGGDKAARRRGDPRAGVAHGERRCVWTGFGPRWHSSVNRSEGYVSTRKTFRSLSTKPREDAGSGRFSLRSPSFLPQAHRCLSSLQSPWGSKSP
jgi:hypothetical protein